MLEVSQLSKSFPGVKALDQVSMSFYPGEVNALLGENGAGKSTLLKVLSGIYQPDEGELFIDTKQLEFLTTNDSTQAGIAIIHQELNLFLDLTVSENIFLGIELKTKWGLLDEVQMNQITQRLIDKLKIECQPQTRVGDLKIGMQQLVEIAKAYYSNASIILMDEPTSALSDAEIESLHQLIYDWKAEGKTIIYISHKMEELFKIADRYTVLRDGKHIASGSMEESSEQELIRYMVGRDVVIERAITSSSTTEEVLTVDRLFSLHKGELLGFYGLMGAGRTELMESIFGARPSELLLKIEGTSVHIKSPSDAIHNGLAFVTEDRKLEGLVMDQDLSFNISLPLLKLSDVIQKGADVKKSALYVEQLAIKTPSVREKCENLSGGNQQKVILAKWLSIHPKVLILDEPTRGIDIQAKNQIYDLIRSQAAQGLGILLVSSEIPELLALSDRIIVMSEGEVTTEFKAQQATEELLMQAALPKKEVI
tara:strand:+ start:1854 stop:3299 length:1446 start_codon:yes stop_codon:yes gene_type:complete